MFSISSISLICSFRKFWQCLSCVRPETASHAYPKSVVFTIKQRYTRPNKRPASTNAQGMLQANVYRNSMASICLGGLVSKQQLDVKFVCVLASVSRDWRKHWARVETILKCCFASMLSVCGFGVYFGWVLRFNQAYEHIRCRWPICDFIFNIEFAIFIIKCKIPKLPPTVIAEWWVSFYGWA